MKHLKQSLFALVAKGQTVLNQNKVRSILSAVCNTFSLLSDLIDAGVVIPPCATMSNLVVAIYITLKLLLEM